MPLTRHPPLTQEQKDKISKENAAEERKHNNIKYCEKHERYHGVGCIDCLREISKEAKA